MAEIVFGFGTSHSTQLSLEPEDWAEQAELDKARTPWDELMRTAPQSRQDDLAEEVQRARHDRAQAALRALSAAVVTHRPDVLVIVGDDQDELFGKDELVPSIALAATDGLLDLPVDFDALPPIRRKSMWAMHGEVEEFYPIATELSGHVAAELSGAGFDISVLRRQPDGRSLGHAWTFIRRRIVGDRPGIPMVPIFLNTYYPPNTPTPARCVSLGLAIAAAVESHPADLRVGLVASGGLSHFVIDEELDHLILDALKAGDLTTLAAVAPSRLLSGTSEILNWITVGAALGHCDFELLDYVPAYRSLAGTGCGFAFGVWTPKS